MGLGTAAKRGGIDLAGGVILLAALSATPAYLGWYQWAEVQALRAEWTVAGPACPVVDQVSPRAMRRKRAPMTFSYGGATWTRSFAAVSCAAVPKRGLFAQGNDYVCSFNNPGAVTVKTADGRATIFQPPPGGRATVTLHDGQVSCVVGGRFSY